MMTRMRIFWSIYCILLGILLLVKLLFRLDFNGWAAALALLLLQSGLFLITGGFGLAAHRHEQGGGNYLFFNGTIALDGSEPAVNILFANATVELIPPLNRLTSITCLFGSATIRVPRGCSVRAVCETAFGSISTPAGALPGFGDRVFIVGDGLQTQLEVRCLFGQVTLLD